MTSANTATPQIRAACYLRISSDPQDKRTGVDRQRDDTALICEVQGWTPVHPPYVDNDRSASNGKDRREWDRLLADVKAGKIDAIVVWNQDRGWRKMADFESLRPMLEPRGVLLATTNIGVIDFRNGDDVFRAQISTAMSEMETAKMRVRMLRAARQKAERGKPQWKCAFGYLPDTRRKEDDDGTREPDPRTAPLVVAAYKAILKEAKLHEIAAIFNDAGAYGLTGKPWTASTVSLFLRSPRNAGLRSHNGEIVGKGNWTQLVDESTWRAAQAKLNTPGRAPGRKSVRQHLLTSVMHCGRDGCNGRLAGNWQMQKHRGGPRAHSIVYRCKKCAGVSIRAEHVEPIIYEIVGGRLAMPNAVNLLKSEIRDDAEAERIRDELATLYGRLDAIAIDRGNGDLDGRQAKIASDTVRGKIDMLERAQESQERRVLFEDIPLSRPEVVAVVKELPGARLRAIIDVLMTVTIAPVGKGSHVFNPERVQIDPKGAE
jgi:DNA invertase Pin-like site-specific DNA recombinase